MRVSLKSALRSTSHQFECLQDQQLIFRTGNNICIRTIGKPECQFIPLSPYMTALLCFKTANNKKSVFTAERDDKSIEVVQYQINGQRKAITLEEQTFLCDIEQVQLLTDEYDSSIVYGIARNRDIAYVFLADFGKGKLLACGYLPAFSDVQVDGRENMRLSVCGHNGSYNYLKTLQYSQGQWQITEQPLKKVQGIIIKHQILPLNRIILITSSTLHILQDQDITKTIQVTQESGHIINLLKIPRGLLLRHNNDVLRLFAEQGEEGVFVEEGIVQLQLESKEKVHSLSLSMNGQEVWLRTYSNSFYVWRCDGVGLDTHAQHAFTKLQISSGNQQLSSLSMSTGRMYALMTGPRSATLWSINRNEFVLGSEFTEGSDSGKTVLAGAINPDGNSLLLAFEDKLRLYLILFTKFKLQAQFQIRRCRTIVYSHSGQLAACHYGRANNSSLSIINLQRLTEIGLIKIGAEPTQIFWNELDDQLLVASENNTIQIYQVGEQTRKHKIKFQESITHARIDYRTKRLIVSTESSVYSVEQGKIVEKIPPPFPDFFYVFPLYGAYFASGRSGILYWSNNLKFQNALKMPLFTASPFSLIARNGYILASRGLSEVLVLQVARQTEKKRSVSDQIVMVQREQILSFFQKVRNIQNSYDMLVTATHLRQEEDKHHYDAAIEQVRNKYQHELEFANQQYLASSVQQARGVKENQKMFENLEKGQATNVADLERMYERRITLDREKIMSLEQECLEQKMRSEKLMEELEKKHTLEIQKVREEYSRRSKEESQALDRQKLRHLEDKKRVQMKLLDIEEENELTLGELQIVKDNTIAQLRLELKLEEQHSEQLMAQQENLKKEVSKLRDKEQTISVSISQLQESLKEAENRTQLLEREVERLQRMVEQRDQIVKEQEQQIASLQKAKYVLSFRTTEIRKDLEPKENTIDKLKAELLNLDEEYRNEKRKAFQMTQRAQKLQAMAGASKRQISGLKITLKCQQRSHDELCSDIYMVVNNVDAKDWNNELVKIYQKYIREERHSTRKDQKRDDTFAEVTRHLAHVQQSLVQVSGGADRLLKGKQKEVVRKMKENSQLVYQLNVMRKKQNQYSRQKKELLSQNARLKRQTGEISARNTTRAHTANTGFTRRVIPSRQGGSRDKSATLDISGILPSREERLESKREKSKLVSARRTLMLQDEMKQKGNKFFDLAKELQNSRNTIRRQDRMIEELNHRLLGMPEQ